MMMMMMMALASFQGLYEIRLNSDWLIALIESVMIGQSYCFNILVYNVQLESSV